MQVELRERAKLHVVVDLAARDDTRGVHDTVVVHAELLHPLDVLEAVEIDARNDAYPEGTLHKRLAPGGRQDVRRRHIHADVVAREHLIAKVVQLLEGGQHVGKRGPIVIALILPLVGARHIAVVALKPTLVNERDMVVAMNAQLTAQAQELSGKVFEARGVRVGFERRIHLVVVVLDDKAREGDAVFLDQAREVGPPHVGVEVADRGVVVALDVLARPARHRGGEVVEIEGAAVDDRPSECVAEQAKCLRIDAAHTLFGKAEIAEDDPSLAVGILPDKRQLAVVSRHGMHRAVL